VGACKLLKTPEQEVVVPRPGLASGAMRNGEYCGLGRGHDNAVATPDAESEPPEDRDIHRAKSPTPAPAMFTRAESTPPPLTPSHSATTSHAPMLSISHNTINSHLPQPIAAGRSCDTRSPNATIMAPVPSPKPHTRPEPRTHSAP